MINSVNHNQIHSALYAQQTNRVEAAYTSNIDTQGSQVNQIDNVSLKGESTLALTYTSGLTMQNRNGEQYGMLQSLVANLLKEQGIDTKIQIGETTVDLETITPENAEELISDDGYFGVEKTSDRIFQFAVGVAGGDPSRLDAIIEGIDKGFNEAKEAFGGWLPDISYETYDAVMEKLDNWQAESEGMVG
ncbi:hypothetical protein [Desulfogranum japonicum]|uniref:hypothetical protein n=1 Tax=Desulfogranum japonicum TaxID=231447 RepID=UPI000426C983|nr:hypothetical protein [Desulfogranum japonicum]